ncbi:hypothetical protein LEP1GSC132_3112 [Leptospira kirschneri str. 200803703]|uniref:Uncharacterized protein n=1 Tax=Leptospira kirschneri str. 200802841 TaxID=1193047 RepID=A0A828Y769_9LEPT|nr:hypothetical protein LEP1GSC131_0487 [Leptospira kirschneri str. 200802841]EMO67597.1 hypothetical protein LEP1GSC132_3112 [Leptospira kirschneri str. 200803703]EMO74233.1 hypothetical protein LEP1GSC127_3297 [Leptospira kirschneri str. 200801925]
MGYTNTFDYFKEAQIVLNQAVFLWLHQHLSFLTPDFVHQRLYFCKPDFRTYNSCRSMILSDFVYSLGVKFLFCP